MKKIALINGSPKYKDSVSGCILDIYKKQLSNHEITEFNFRTKEVKDIEKLCENQIFVLAFPLYVDGVPAHVLSCLQQMAEYLQDKKLDISVYAIVNCGFYEGKQNQYALEIIKNWCVKSNIRWCQGIGVGGGGMISMLNNPSSASEPLKDIIAMINKQIVLIEEGRMEENQYESPNFPKLFYKIAAEQGWRQLIKKNGLKTKALFTQIR